jgi:methyl-accepting chemotaxis protein
MNGLWFTAETLHFPWYVQSAFVALILLALVFVLFFLVPAIRVGYQLNRVLIGASTLKQRDDFGIVFERYPSLSHFWREFSETLHKEKTHNAKTGMLETVGLRATVPANGFFTEDALVNNPTRAEFFKHLPGILTGIGIIGTFTGLLVHLQQFHVTEDATTIRSSLEQLLSGVHDAFIVSATAILLAMVITLLEKVTLVRLYSRVQKLTQVIDERYSAGVGEEYLARLVGAAEESASQSKILKDALVGDLKAILMEISDKQIQAFSVANAKLGVQVGEAVAAQLRTPLETLAAVTRDVRGDQGSAVQQLIADLLSRFSEKLEGLFGSQISGINSMQSQALEALRVAIEQLQKMSNSVEGAGQKAADTLTDRLSETLEKLDQRQLVMTEEMRKFVQEIRSLVAQTQTESQAEVQKLLSDLGKHTASLIADLADKSGVAVSTMGTQVNDLSGKIGEAITQMSSDVGRLEAVVTNSITRMNSGAEMLALASEDFARAGQGVSGVLKQSEALTSQMTQTATALSAASRSLENVLTEYRATREAVSKMLISVQATVDAARRDASLTSDILQRLDGSASKLALAQKAADQYLDGVTQVLGEAHQSFSETMSRTLNLGNRAFHDEMTGTIKMLRETITELEETLSNLLPRTPTPAR